MTMLANVDIEGSGQKVTTITNTGLPTLDAANDTVLSSLTVENTNGDVAIRASGASPMIEHVTARSTGAATSIGIKLGMGAAPTLIHVTTASDGDGVENNAAAVMVRDSVLAGAVNGIENNAAGVGASKIVNTQIDGGADEGGIASSFTCLGAYDGTFSALDYGCQ